MDDNILTDSAIKKMTLNTLFERYMATRELKEPTRVNYIRVWNNRVKDEIGNIKVVQMLPSHIKAYYSKLSKAGYAHSTIKYINNMIFLRWKWRLMMILSAKIQQKVLSVIMADQQRNVWR